MHIDAFLELSKSLPILDVRSPKEFCSGHIPSAISFPLFSDAERADIGTSYKQEGPDRAIELGYKYANPKIDHFLSKASKLAVNNTLLLHCWRGGLRSESMVKLLVDNGFHVLVLEGGYKAYRRWVKQILARDYQLILLGGYTGSAKTEILHELKKLGENVLDLEGLAQHKGSVFGSSATHQPSTEQFENNCAQVLSSFTKDETIWVEDESHHIGGCCIDHTFYTKMRESDILIIEKGMEERIEHLCSFYGKEDGDFLREGFRKIMKRLGGDRTRNAIMAIEHNDLPKAANIALHYYDKAYKFGLDKRSGIEKWSLNLASLTHVEAACKILEWKAKNNG